MSHKNSRQVSGKTNVSSFEAIARIRHARVSCTDRSHAEARDRHMCSRVVHTRAVERPMGNHKTASPPPAHSLSDINENVCAIATRFRCKSSRSFGIGRIVSNVVNYAFFWRRFFIIIPSYFSISRITNKVFVRSTTVSKSPPINFFRIFHTAPIDIEADILHTNC